MQYCEKQQHLRSLHPQDPAREQKIAKELGKRWLKRWIIGERQPASYWTPWRPRNGDDSGMTNPRITAPKTFRGSKRSL